jgi:hypothetical protein
LWKINDFRAKVEWAFKKYCHRSQLWYLNAHAEWFILMFLDSTLEDSSEQSGNRSFPIFNLLLISL